MSHFIFIYDKLQKYLICNTFLELQLRFLAIKCGRDLKTTVWRMLQSIFSNHLSINTTWTGVGDKACFRDLFLKTIVQSKLNIFFLYLSRCVWPYAIQMDLTDLYFLQGPSGRTRQPRMPLMRRSRLTLCVTWKEHLTVKAEKGAAQLRGTHSRPLNYYPGLLTPQHHWQL